MFSSGDIVQYVARHSQRCGCDAGLKRILDLACWKARDGKHALVDRDQYVGPDGKGGGVRIVFRNADGFYAASSDWCWSPPGHVRLVRRDPTRGRKALVSR